MTTTLNRLEVPASVTISEPGRLERIGDLSRQSAVAIFLGGAAVGVLGGATYGGYLVYEGYQHLPHATNLVFDHELADAYLPNDATPSPLPTPTTLPYLPPGMTYEVPSLVFPHLTHTQYKALKRKDERMFHNIVMCAHGHGHCPPVSSYSNVRPKKEHHHSRGQHNHHHRR